MTAGRPRPSITNAPYWGEARETFDQYFVAAAEERRSQVDPSGTEVRFALCQKVASASPAEVLDLLERGWPDRHEDFGLCAFHAFRSLHGDKSLDEERKAKAYLSRFASSQYLGVAATRSGFATEAVQVASDPIALRWLRMGLQEASSFLAGDDPFLPPDLVGAWEVTRLSQFESSEEARQAASPRLLKMIQERGGCPEIGLVYFQMSMEQFDGEWIDVEEAYERFATSWKESSADDPYVPWGVVWPYLRSCPKPLRAEDMGALREIVERYPAETVRPFAECILAREAMLRGDGDAARSHYEAALVFDPGGARLPGPYRGEMAMLEARERMIEFWAIRDPERLGPIVGMELDDGGGFRQPVYCGNAPVASKAEILRWATGPIARAGALTAAIERYERSLTAEGWAPGDDVAFDYARLCFQGGGMDRLAQLAGRLETRARGAALPHGGPGPGYGTLAARLRTCEEDVELLREKGLDAGILRLEGCTPGFDRATGRPNPFLDQAGAEALWVLTLIGSEKGIDAACGERFALPPDPTTLMLASAGDSDRSLDYLLDQYLDAPAETGWPYLLLSALSQRGPEAAHRVMERIVRDGVAQWPSYRSLLEGLSIEDVWRACAPLRGHADEAVRDLAEVILAELEKRDPWIVYALKGE